MEYKAKAARLPAFDRLTHPPEDTFMIPGMGAQPIPVKEWVAANDNVVGGKFDGAPKAVGYWPMQDVSPPHGQYIGLTRAGDPNGCADDLVGWSAVPANSLGKGNPFDRIGERKGDFMQTYTGRKFWPMDPRPSEVCIRDIAHSLSLQCRYAGHCRRFYSVAEHSTLIARWLVGKDKTAALWGLLHDASEAFLVDVPRPLKPFLTNYKEAEAKVTAAIAMRFGLPLDMPAVVKEADDRIIGNELANLVPMAWHARHADPLDVPMMYWSPAEAEEEFLAMFAALTGELV